MKYLFIFFISILIVQCNLPASKKGNENLMPAGREHKSTDNIYQVWTVEDITHPLPKDIYDNSDTVHKYGLPGLVFLPDSTIIESPRAKMRMGKLVINGKKFDASFMDGGKATYIVKSISPKIMELERHEDNRITFITLKGDGYVYDDAKKCPFNIQYNLWRIKPKDKEDEHAIRERIRQCVNFYKIFLNDNVERNETEIDFTGLPACFKWYAGGISVRSEKKIDRKLVDCFYSMEQALQARQMLDDIIMKKYVWDKDEPNWIKQDIPVLQQIHDGL